MQNTMLPQWFDSLEQSSVSDSALRFFERIDDNPTFFRKYFAGVASESAAAPARQGTSDQCLKKLVREIKPYDFPFAVLDFGCGDGRFLAALLSNSALPLQNIHYVAVDCNEQRLDKAESYVKKYRARTILGSLGFCRCVSEVDMVLKDYMHSLPNSRCWNKPHSLPSQPSFKFQYIFAINVLHEIPVIELSYLLEHLMFRLAYGGHFHIQEPTVLPRAEGRFLLWDEDSLRNIFLPVQPHKKQPLQFRSESFLSTSGIPLVHARVTKLMGDCDSIDHCDFYSNIVEQVLPRMKEKVKRILQSSRFLGKSSPAAFLYYNLALQTIASYREECEQVILKIGKTNSGAHSEECPLCHETRKVVGGV